MAIVQLIATAALLASIAVAGIAISIGIADAQDGQAMLAGSSNAPDTGLVLALMLGAIAVMGILSAAAVRFSGRPRGR